MLVAAPARADAPTTKRSVTRQDDTKWKSRLELDLNARLKKQPSRKCPKDVFGVVSADLLLRDKA